MGSFTGYLMVYVLGGITFIPLLVVLVLVHALLTFPQRQPTSEATDPDVTEKEKKYTSPIQQPTDDQYSLKSGTDVLAEKFQRTHESDVASGYFSVWREYTPFGFKNGRPPERTNSGNETGAGANGGNSSASALSSESSPSVYQSMYRSIFDRKQPPTIDPAKNNGKNNKRNRNVFYIVLRHGHLMLYDDAEQLEVRHVISLAHHDVSVYAGGEEIPEGELWIKRNAICLSRKQDSIADLRGMTPPFYLFSESQSDKEDFYFALLKNQERIPDAPNCPPLTQYYDVKHIITLVQRLHSSEEHLQTRWLNAILGRLFLAMYKTPEVEEFVRKKVTKKISRVQKPSFISRIALHKIDMGDGAPFVTNPRLKDLTIDGDCVVEADVSYSGNFRLEIAATARIELGQRFKAREVDLLLAVVLRSLTGRMLFRFKPPPSNRIWFCFETTPNMVMKVEPIVSSRQITYGIILRSIESRIREVIAESIVLPFWDDVPFLDTRTQTYRGGIWEREIPKFSSKDDIPDETGTQAASTLSSDGDALDLSKAKDDRSVSVPELPDRPLKPRKGSKGSDSGQPEDSAASSAVDKWPASPPPTAIRSRTFSNVADPVVTPDHGKFDKADAKFDKKDATSSMIEISSRSQPIPLVDSPSGSPPKGSPSLDKLSLADSFGKTDDADAVADVLQRQSSVYSTTDSAGSRSVGQISRSSTVNEESKRNRTLENLTKTIASSISSLNEKRQSVGSPGPATNSGGTKKWGWNVLSKGDQNKSNDSLVKLGSPEYPIGRGRPLPPPGTPLPPPDRSNFKNPSLAVPKRKPVGPPPLPERNKEENKRPVPKPPLPKRKNVPAPESSVEFNDEVLVVEAPSGSEPGSPLPVHATHPLQNTISDSQEIADVESEDSNSKNLTPPSEQNTAAEDSHSDSGFEQIPDPLPEDDLASTKESSSAPSVSVPTTDDEQGHELVGEHETPSSAPSVSVPTTDNEQGREPDLGEHHETLPEELKVTE